MHQPAWCNNLAPWSDIGLTKTQDAGMDGLYSRFLDNHSTGISTSLNASVIKRLFGYQLYAIYISGIRYAE